MVGTQATARTSVEQQMSLNGGNLMAFMDKNKEEVPEVPWYESCRCIGILQSFQLRQLSETPHLGNTAVFGLDYN
jgi:hypothetical protein